MREFYEFFAGGGMVRAGLGADWHCVFANDFDHKKSRIYRENWGEGELRTVDIDTLTTKDLPGSSSLAWASFPCQDLSLAGGGAGLKGDRSGTFWPFWRLMEGLVAEDRPPRMIGLENVCGTLNSHGGKDFATICGAFDRTGYSVGAIVIDAALFVPQSRPRPLPNFSTAPEWFWRDCVPAGDAPGIPIFTYQKSGPERRGWIVRPVKCILLLGRARR